MQKGDFEANIESLKKHETNLVVVRDYKGGKSSDSVPCPHCFGFMKPCGIHKHVKNCSMTPIEKNSKKSLLASRFLLSSLFTDCAFHDVHIQILSKMNRDDLHLIIRNDTSLLLYGAEQLQKKQKCRYHDIRYSLGCLARLLIEFRKKTENGNARAEEPVISQKFDAVVCAVKALTGYKGPRNIESPNTFCKIGYCLRNLVLIIHATTLKEDDATKVNKCRNFLELYESDWTILSNNAKATYAARKANEPEKLPFENDVRYFRTFCLNEIQRYLIFLGKGCMLY